MPSEDPTAAIELGQKSNQPEEGSLLDRLVEEGERIRREVMGCLSKLRRAGDPAPPNKAPQR